MVFLCAWWSPHWLIFRKEHPAAVLWSSQVPGEGQEGREMLAGVVPIGSKALSMLSPAGSCLTNKRCQEEPGLPGTSVNSQLAQRCSCWKETLETL